MRVRAAVRVQAAIRKCESPGGAAMNDFTCSNIVDLLIPIFCSELLILLYCINFKIYKNKK